MSGTWTNPDHSRPCSITLASISFICFSYLSLLSVSLYLVVSLTKPRSLFFINKEVKLIYILFTKSGPDHLLRHTAARVLLLLLEPLDLLLDLLRVDLCLAVLQLLVLVPWCRKKAALLEKRFEAGRQSLISPRHRASGIRNPVHLPGHLLHSPGQPV